MATTTYVPGNMTIVGTLTGGGISGGDVTTAE